jgi:phosphoribosylpyrophosphate synthetase
MVPRFEPFADWMYFPHLDALDASVSGVYTMAWRLTDKSSDPWTHRIQQFKDRNVAAVVGARRALATALLNLIEAKRWNPSFTALTVALSSPDTDQVPEKPLPATGRRCAHHLGFHWDPALLKKRPHRSLHSLGSAAERGAELQKANYRATTLPEDIRRVLLLDDVVTRGETMSAIANAIKEASPHVKVIGIALGKSERQSYAEKFGYMISNDHVPALWAQRWDKP